MEHFASCGNKTFDPVDVTAECDKYLCQIPKLATQASELLSLVSYIDLTTLAGDDTADRVANLTDKAIEPLNKDISCKFSAEPVHCAAVCVYPARVADVVKRKAFNGAKAAKLEVASAFLVAAGFPSGQYRIETKVHEVRLCVEDGATEIDIVISRGEALNGNWQVVFHEVRALKDACGSAHMKTILATGELGSLENVYKASWAAMLAGSDFIKTSTGKESVNATLPVSYVMCSAIKDYEKLTGKKVGFKPAGGIRTVEDALGFRILVENVLGKEWLTPKLFRLGASSLLGNVEEALKEIPS